MPNLRIGTDICHIPRIRRLLTSRHSQRFLQRLLTDHEMPQVVRGPWRPDLQPAEAMSRITTLVAGRWAAKEAAIKAAFPRRLSFQDVIVLKSDDREPYAVILDKDPKPRSEAGEGPDGQIARVSISHDGEYATAVCMIATDPVG